ncbi:hypothetical protein NIES267_72850 (plasmid) [Calothrix parasitica NIES-267]|uniref:Uncharacterized protein n=1 Tax=Calothrix parasitica NIES-267 TaxID=1973488 RepID=A0A1Z4M2Y1_9CYAN|nr:hypothetical protein NIES267_72850 [Calothrix parasitica NIES-267]
MREEGRGKREEVWNCKGTVTFIRNSYTVGCRGIQSISDIEVYKRRKELEGRRKKGQDL